MLRQIFSINLKVKFLFIEFSRDGLNFNSFLELCVNFKCKLGPLVDLYTLLIKYCSNPDESSSLELATNRIFIIFLEKAIESLTSLWFLHVLVQVKDLHFIIEKFFRFWLLLTDAFLEWPVVFHQGNSPLVPAIWDKALNDLVSVSLSVLNHLGIKNSLLANLGQR